MMWLPNGEKNFDDMSIPFDTTHKRDRQTDRQTAHDGIALMHIIARQKHAHMARHDRASLQANQVV